MSFCLLSHVLSPLHSSPSPYQACPTGNCLSHNLSQAPSTHILSHFFSHTIITPIVTPITSPSGMPYWKISRHSSPPWEAFPLLARDKIVVLSPDATNVLTEFSSDEVEYYLPPNPLMTHYFIFRCSFTFLLPNTYNVYVSEYIFLTRYM